MKAIINARIYDYINYIENGYIVFDEQIHEVGCMRNFKDCGYQIIDAKGGLLLPSFVCAHSHIYSIFARGLSLPFAPHNFLDILKQMWWKIDAKIDNEITYYSGIASAREFLLNGVTTVIDHHASGEIIGSLEALNKSVCKVAKMRGIFCFESSDRYDIKECVKENKNFARKHHSNDVSGLFGMHASMTLGDDSLKLIKRNLNDIPLHVHVSESSMDEEDCIQKYNYSIIERFEKFDLLNPDSLIVHGVYLSENELDIISKHNCYLVVNTTSNMNNAVGLPNVKNYLNHGIKVMVGNDGLNSNMASEYMNVYYTSHLKNSSPIQLSLDDTKTMIINAYEYVSKRLNVNLGQLKEGFVSDFMLIDYMPFTKMDSNNVFGHIFFGLFPSFKPKDVYSHGKKVVANYQLTGKKLNAEFMKTQDASNKLWIKVMEENK